VWDEDSPLGVRVTANGNKTFIVMVGSGKRHTIGSCGVVKLSEARVRIPLDVAHHSGMMSPAIPR
jgi:hypothetical protein